MARYTLIEAQEFYDIAKIAYKNALTNKSYDIAGRNKENQRIESLKKEMDYWADIVASLKSGGNGRSTISVRRVIPYV